MALTKEAKQEMIEKFGSGAADTGSTRVQVAMLTERINQLTEHLRTHSHEPVSQLHAADRSGGVPRIDQGVGPPKVGRTRTGGWKFERTPA